LRGVAARRAMAGRRPKRFCFGWICFQGRAARALNFRL
jgi:hypothetical protein